ncbi:Serum response factor-binding protein 1 [Collichthys lucidus]|uniref:Serum response factor-binding protein 1 n=1 Tax=Collichthys lucidus TaxID=240159 RepID=A0A4U5VJT9_COLLU|nr:Serum response factor-binding protein 1 [Collichthys lucidus]
MDEVEKMVLPAEEKEKKEEEKPEEEEEVEDDAGDEEEEEEKDSDAGEQEGGDGEKKERDATPPAAEKLKKPKEKKQSGGLNLNNEVVKMRKEVKRVRALIIRKLTRQMGALKKKKGKETEIERNQRRADRLLEEIHAMKVLSPDLVTKTALQKKLNFEQECKNPKSTISDRAIARIATHPQFNKKIEDIKAAVKAFKDERMKGAKQGEKEKVKNKAGNVTPQSPDKHRERISEKKEDIPEEPKEIVDDEEGDGILKDTIDATVAEPEKETEKATHSADTADSQTEERHENVTAASVKSSDVKDIVKNKPLSKDAEKIPVKPAPEVFHKKKDEEESDLESSDDEEKEYFDDSTEERFRKQSSQSEESDEDDFFVGKVSKFKKKKKQNSVEGEKGHEKKEEPTDQVQSQLDELESRLKSKALQSVFCSSLSASKPGGGRGAGRGRGGDKFRGQGKPRGGGVNRDFSKQSKFQRDDGETERNSGSKFSKSKSTETGFPSVGRGRGRGRGNDIRQKDRRGGGVFSHQAPQQALHPSWEASKKRKEQQGQILAFQGKKIKFDDDD